MNLYHISENPNLTLMIPRVPVNKLTKKGYENSTIGRISFAPTIGDCISAAPRGKAGEILYVYKPVQINKNAVYRPKPSEVPDAKYSHEVWYLEPTTVKKVAVIVVGDAFMQKQFLEPRAWEKHFILRYHNFKRFKNDPTKEQVDEYLNTQPMYQKQLQTLKKAEQAKKTLMKAALNAAGAGVFLLVGNKLKSLIKK
jgi:hypothetical protein